MWRDVLTVAGILAAAAVGLLGVRQSKRANRTSKEALAVAKKAQALQLEARDVRWERGYDRARDVYWIRNVGTDRARDVHLGMDIVDPPRQPRREVTEPVVEPLKGLEIDVSDLVAPIRKLIAEKPLDAYGFRVPADVEFDPWVTWKSEAGVPGQKVWGREKFMYH